MSSYTTNLNLLKKNPLTDGSDTFNISTMLNDNWDKIDTFAGQVSPVDASPTQSSTKPVQSGGVYTALAGKANASDIKTFSRPNLITNWYFVGGGSQLGTPVMPINSRGQTSYSGTANAYTIDRWRTSNANTTVAITSSGLKISASTGNTPYLLQPITHLARFIRGKTVTLSIMTSSSVYSATATLPSSDPSAITIYCSIANVGQVIYMGGAWFVRLLAASGGNNTYAAVKLEIGDSQTLWYNAGTAQSPLYYLTAAPVFADELLRCSPPSMDTTYDINTALPVYRQEAFYASDTTPSLQGAINWTYS